MFKGACHIHSTYSDGDFSLAELRDIYRKAGCAFAFVTDHADYFDEAKVAAYVAECHQLSSADFLFIAGLEYSCENRMHILGYGLTALNPDSNPQNVISFIEAAGGVSVIAHPRDAAFETIEAFDVLPNGLEVWNSKYDGRYAPRPQTFELFARLQARRPQMRAFYGQDQHWRNQYRGLMIEVEAVKLTRADLLEALRQGNFTAVKDELRLPASGTINDDLRKQFAAAHNRSDSLRNVFKRAKAAADSLGLTIPPAVKAQLRRLF